jgi:signal transduction histidine kinase
MSDGNPAVIGDESTSPVPEPALEAAHRRTRRILAIGLGGMIVPMLAAGIDGVRVLQGIREQGDLIRADARARTVTLVSIQTKLLLSDTFVRDYLFDPDENRSTEHNDQLRRVWADLEQGLDTYATTPDANEAEMAAQLKRKIDLYWESISPSLRWSNRERRTSGLAFYNSTVLPSRVSILEITAEIDNAHSRQLADGESRMTAGFGDLRSELLWTFVLSLVAATILAIGSAIYILRLESETRFRYKQVAAGRVEMGKLSQRFVAAQEQERKSISRELHDQVGQTLNALLVDAGNLQKRIPESDKQSGELLNSIRRLADTSVNEVRDIALLLRPSMLDDLGLTAAIQWQAREVSRRTGLAVKVSAEAEADDLPEDLSICLYRIAQEALQNVARHAQAKTVHIELKQDLDRLVLSVHDDGIGFDAEKVRGFGRVGMEERLRQIGGVLRVTSQPGKGTTVVAEVPIPVPGRLAGS